MPLAEGLAAFMVGGCDLPVYNDVQATEGLDDLLHSPVHFCIAASQICHNRQAVLHLLHL